MKKRMLSIFLAVLILCSTLPQISAAEDPLTVDFPVIVSFSEATGIDLNLRLNPLLVEKAELVEPAPILTDTTYIAHQTEDKVKAAIASVTPITFSGALFTLRLTLKKEAGVDDELCKLLQVKINEKITWQANDCILLSGVRDGGLYNHAVSIGFNEGSAMLDGKAYEMFTPVTAEGEHTLEVTDLGGRVRTARFAIDMTPPIITIAPYDTAPSRGPLTVYASVNEGTLKESSHVFSENGSYTFVAEDAAGNRAEKTVTISHLYKTFTMTLKGAPEMPELFVGERLQIDGWQLLIQYDTGAEEILPVTEDMLTYSTDTAGETTAVLRWNGEELHFPILVKAVTLTKIELSRLPDKTQYRIGTEEFDPSGGEVTLYYNNGATTVIPLTADMVSGFSNKKAGIITLTVSYGGMETTFTVEIFGILYGDVNGDGTIDDEDLDLLRTYLANYDYDTDTSSEAVADGADMNADGVIDTKDLALLRKYLENEDQGPSSSADTAVIKASDAEGKQGETVTITATISENPGIAGLIITPQCLPSGIVFTDAAIGALSGFHMEAGINLVFDAPVNITADGTLCTVTFSIGEDVAPGSYDVYFIVRSCSNLDGEEVVLTTVKGTLRVTCKTHSFGSYTKKDDTQHSRTCSVCGIVETADHTQGDAVKENEVPAACEAEGSYEEVIYCSVCDAELSRETKTIPAHGHDWGDWVETKAPTETEKGEEMRTCKHDPSHTETREIPELSHVHSLTLVPAKNATCTEAGNKAYYICDGCGRWFEDEEGTVEITDKNNVVIPATGHTPAKAVKEHEVPATCEKEGSYEEVVYCSVCGAELSREKKAIPTPGHSLTLVPAKGATCTEAGSKAYYVCSVCGKWFEDAKGTVEITNHNSVVIPTTGHTPAKAVKEHEVAATCEKGGSYEEVVYCSACSTELSREKKAIPALGHRLTLVPAKEPTATEEGHSAYYVCSVCGKWFKDAEGKVEITDHNSVVIPKQEPTGLLGDINFDGKVNTTDYMLLKRYVLNTYRLTDKQKAVADINGDGKINSTDYMLLKRYVLGTYKFS